jgi:hypothetical protein
VSVATAHKILIATAIAFFLGYALWELGRYAETGDAAALAWSGGATVIAIGLGIYLRRFFRSLGAALRADGPR